MDKLRVFQIATIGLLLLNVVLMAFIFFAPRPGGGASPLGPREDLGLDEVQHERFLTLARAHQRQMRTANDRQTELLQAYFLQLNTDSADSPGPIPPEVAVLEREKITSTYQHLLDLKKMLRPEQQAEYPAFVDAALERILLRKSDVPPPPPGK